VIVGEFRLPIRLRVTHQQQGLHPARVPFRPRIGIFGHRCSR
jgi:hypothetical protein